MFYTVASILITVVTLLFGVGYIVYKNIIQMIKNLDEKYECRLQIKLSEINTKFNETITEMETRIKRLENTTKVIKLLKDNYLTQENDFKEIIPLASKKDADIFIFMKHERKTPTVCFNLQCNPHNYCAQCIRHIQYKNTIKEKFLTEENRDKETKSYQEYANRRKENENTKYREELIASGIKIKDNFERPNFYLKKIDYSNMKVCKIKNQFYHYINYNMERSFLQDYNNFKYNYSILLPFNPILLSDFIKIFLTDIIEIPFDNCLRYVKTDFISENNKISPYTYTEVFYPIGKIHNVTKEVTFY